MRPCRKMLGQQNCHLDATATAALSGYIVRQCTQPHLAMGARSEMHLTAPGFGRQTAFFETAEGDRE